jgi:universal stress protein A
MTPTYRHLLVCLDLSGVSRQVLARGVALARQGGSGLTVLHVVDHRPLPDLDYGLGTIPGFELDLDTLLANARSRLESLIAEAGAADAGREIVAGIPHSEITRIAGDLGADLIVLGSATRSGLGRLLGSTARSVLDHAACDVLAVRVPEHADEDVGGP